MLSNCSPSGSRTVVFFYHWQRRINVFACVCLSVCLQDYSKTRAWIWMKCCVSTDVGTWTNWLTFEPDPDHSPDGGTGLLSPLSYKRCYNFTSGKSDVYVLVAAARRGFRMVLRPTAAATRGFTMVSFTETVSRRSTFVGSTCAPPSALLVVYYYILCMGYEPAIEINWNWNAIKKQ